MWFATTFPSLITLPCILGGGGGKSCVSRLSQVSLLKGITLPYQTTLQMCFIQDFLSAFLFWQTNGRSSFEPSILMNYYILYVCITGSNAKKVSSSYDMYHASISCLTWLWITISFAVIVQAPMLGSAPCNLQCPSCHASVQTRVDYEPNTKTHLFALLLCLM